MDEALKALYYSVDNTGSFGGVERLYRSAVESHVPNITPDVVRDFLSRQRAYTLHNPARRHFTRNRTYVGTIDKQWQADLADMVVSRLIIVVSVIFLLLSTSLVNSHGVYPLRTKIASRCVTHSRPCLH
jgi:hypothetical protein